MNKRKAYVILPDEKDENGNYIPCITVENEPGYHRTDWEWGPDLEAAEAIAQHRNEVLGHSKKDAWEIMISSMAAQPDVTDVAKGLSYDPGVGRYAARITAAVMENLKTWDAIADAYDGNDGRVTGIGSLEHAIEGELSVIIGTIVNEMFSDKECEDE